MNSANDKSNGGVWVLVLLGLAFFVPVEWYIPPLTVDQAIDRAADRRGIPRSLLHALVEVESAKRVDAESHKGARGLSQVMPFNATRCGLSSADYLWHPILNVECGAQILAEEIARLGNFRDALTVYNCGRVNCPAGRQYAELVTRRAARG